MGSSRVCWVSEVAQCLVVQVNDNGISFFDVTSNVTLDSVTVTDTAKNGISLTPTLHGKTLLTDNNGVYPTFRFCDVDRNLFVYPGEEFKYFPTHVTNWQGCVRTFETKEKYAIKVTMKATRLDYYTSNTADFYNGYDTSAASRISQYTSDWNGQVSMQWRFDLPLRDRYIY